MFALVVFLRERIIALAWVRRVVVLGLAFAALSTSSALAKPPSVTVGHTGGEDETPCGGEVPGVLFADLGRDYAVPPGGGVITSFSFQSNALNAGEPIDFLVLREVLPSPTPVYAVVGRTRAVTLAGTGVETFPAYISVKGGDILGFWVGDTVENCIAAGDYVAQTGSIDDPNVGDKIAWSTVIQFASLNESAHLVQPSTATAPPNAELKVSPHGSNPGNTITVSGSVAKACRTGHKRDSATVYSDAFKGAAKHSFAGVPAVYVPLRHSNHRAFSFELNLSNEAKAGTYSIHGRCGGTGFGSAKLEVIKPAAS